MKLEALVGNIELRAAQLRAEFLLVNLSEG
jgi:hypothetical protein